MKKRQTMLSLFSIIVLGLLFVGMQAFVPVDGLAQSADPMDRGGVFTGPLESAGPHNFYPVTPCRISTSATYYSPWAVGEYRGPFPVGTTRCFSNYGTGNTIGRQGGNQAGCQSPTGFDPGGFHVVVTAIPVSGSGHVRIFPADVPMPMASVLNWSANTGTIADAVSADSTVDPNNDDEFCIYIGGPATGGSTHIIMDVMGYYD